MPDARCSAVRYSQCGGMSGESVSITMADSGNCSRQPPQLQRAIEGHGAAEPQLEAELDEFIGLLRAAVEGMGDPAHPGLRASA